MDILHSFLHMHNIPLCSMFFPTIVFWWKFKVSLGFCYNNILEKITLNLSLFYIFDSVAIV